MATGSKKRKIRIRELFRRIRDEEEATVWFEKTAGRERCIALIAQ